MAVRHFHQHLPVRIFLQEGGRGSGICCRTSAKLKGLMTAKNAAIGAGGTATGLGISALLEMGEITPQQPPPGAQVPTPSHAPTTRPKASGGGRGVHVCPPDRSRRGAASGMRIQFGGLQQLDEESQMPEEVLQGAEVRNPATEMDQFFPDGQMNVRDAMSFTGKQQLDPKKKSLIQAILGGLGKAF